MKRITLAESAGFCFGVKRAVDTAIKMKEKYNSAIYTLGPLIHNNDVVDFLKKNSIFPIELDNIARLKENDTIIIRSHGVAEKTLNILKVNKFNIIDATCPFVENIHKKVKKYYDLGYSIIIVGDKNHPEVIGINGWCNNSAVILKSGVEPFGILSKVCVVSQTTERQATWEAVLTKVIKTSKEIVAFNTICSATEVRQKTAEELSVKMDAMIVIGGFNSSNTTKLYEICKKNCENTVHIENLLGIPDEFINDKNIKSIGVTAGASTPDWIIKETILKMNDNISLNENEQLTFMKKNDVQIIVGRVIKGEIISVNEKEAFLNIGYKADGYLPKKEVTEDESIKLNSLFKIGDVIDVKIINRKDDEGNIVLSIIELETEKASKLLREAFESKNPISVQVKKVVNGGLICSLMGLRVFVPASHLELYHIENLDSYLNKELQVTIIEFDDSNRNVKIVGSRRLILQNEAEKKRIEVWNTLEKDQIVDGIVRRLTDFGAFVEVSGVDGLLHVSEISWAKVNKPSNYFNIGDVIKVYILDLDKENKKLSLSIKKLSENPWINLLDKYLVNSIVLCKVVRFTNFGAFVELESGVDGLIHISEISHKQIERISDVLQIGQDIKAKILEVNEETRKISLSIKQINV
ncbi:MAG: (E)-4-hydroxy-3-methyl-but-2-enyl pyrophosphate reductase [Clostridium sp.]|jgi:(E)-4-hydroxy-3-methyl-but-2-enyl pyrophosphate reductase